VGALDEVTWECPASIDLLSGPVFAGWNVVDCRMHGYHLDMHSASRPHPADDRCDPQLVDLLRGQTAAQKMSTLDQLWHSAVDFVSAGVRAQHPEWDDARVGREVASRMAGVRQEGQ
jgi:hypothetical protein